MSSLPLPYVFIDADVLFAGSASASEAGASLVVLRMAEITLLKAITSEQVIVEVERNLTVKMPTAMPTFRLLVDRCLEVVPNLVICNWCGPGDFDSPGLFYFRGGSVTEGVVFEPFSV